MTTELDAFTHTEKLVSNLRFPPKKLVRGSTSDTMKNKIFYKFRTTGNRTSQSKSQQNQLITFFVGREKGGRGGFFFLPLKH